MKHTTNFSTPRVSNFSNPNSSTLEFNSEFSSSIANIRIERNSGGFAYHDIGFQSRQFKTIDSLIWEFDFPAHLKPKLKALSSNGQPQILDSKPQTVYSNMIQSFEDIEDLKKSIEDIRSLCEQDFKNVTHQEDRFYVYAFIDKSRGYNWTKFGDRWVKAGDNPLESCQERVREQQGTSKDKISDGTVELIKIWDASEYAKKHGRFHKGGHVDDHIRRKIGRVQYQDWHDLNVVEMCIRASQVLSADGQTLPSVGLSTAQYDTLERVIDCFNNGERVIMAELFARFGKTIFSGAVSIETGSQLTIVASYVKTVFASFNSQLISYEQFKEIVHIDTQDKDYKEKIKTALSEGKKVFAYLSLCKGAKRQERIDFLYSLEIPCLTLIDEADLGAHRPGQAIPLINAQKKEDRVILLTGTNSDRAIREWADKVDSLISYTYYEALVDKKESQLKLSKMK